MLKGTRAGRQKLLLLPPRQMLRLTWLSAEFARLCLMNPESKPTRPPLALFAVVVVLLLAAAAWLLLRPNTTSSSTTTTTTASNSNPSTSDAWNLTLSNWKTSKSIDEQGNSLRYEVKDDEELVIVEIKLGNKLERKQDWLTGLVPTLLSNGKSFGEERAARGFLSEGLDASTIAAKSERSGRLAFRVPAGSKRLILKLGSQEFPLQ
jgi:hypothetical protein